MLESLVLWLLDSYIGAYVDASFFNHRVQPSCLRDLTIRALSRCRYTEGIDTSKLSIGKSAIVLNNVKLKREAFTSMGLPINVKYGFIGRFEINIPWMNPLGRYANSISFSSRSRRILSHRHDNLSSSGPPQSSCQIF